MRVARRRSRKPPMLRSILWLALSLCFCGNRFTLIICQACANPVFLVSKYPVASLGSTAFAHLLTACGCSAWEWLQPWTGSPLPPSAQVPLPAWEPHMPHPVQDMPLAQFFSKKSRIFYTRHQIRHDLMP